MGNQLITSLHAFVMMFVCSVSAVSEEFYFQLIDAPSSTECADYVSRVGTAVSAIRCAADCSRNGKCRGIVYDQATDVCKAVRRNYTFPDPVCQAENGASYYSEVCDRFLISGPQGVENNQLSESSNYCNVRYPNHPNCQPPGARPSSAVYSRLNSTGMLKGGWIPAFHNQQQYVQVDFLKATIVSRIALQGRYPVTGASGQLIIRYVTSFKFLHSDDCSAYEELKDDYGNTLIFDGNSSPYETIFRDLPRRVKARCFRINPVTWPYEIGMRFDLLGCQ